MKLTLISALAVAFVGTGSALASPQVIDDLDTVSPAPTAEQIEEALQGADADELEQRGGWHCTAFPDGSGHSHGFDFFDIHYSHAYEGAMMQCEYATHRHCHDVHCHYDH